MEGVPFLVLFMAAAQWTRQEHRLLLWHQVARRHGGAVCLLWRHCQLRRCMYRTGRSAARPTATETPHCGRRPECDCRCLGPGTGRRWVEPRCMTARDRLRACDVKFFWSSNLTHKSCGIFVASWGFAHCIGTRAGIPQFFISP